MVFQAPGRRLRVQVPGAQLDKRRRFCPFWKCQRWAEGAALSTVGRRAPYQQPYTCAATTMGGCGGRGATDEDNAAPPGRSVEEDISVKADVTVGGLEAELWRLIRDPPPSLFARLTSDMQLKQSS